VAVRVERAGELDPADPGPWLALGDLAHGAQDFNKALTMYRNAKEIDPENPEVVLSEGQILPDLKKIDEAARTLGNLAQNANATSVMTATAGMLLADVKKSDEAISLYESALEKDENYATAHFLLASALARKGKFKKAARHYEQFLALSPEGEKANVAREHLAVCKAKAAE
jgi:cytochrome c-type biogenesis protein CcmH/NrfG